MSPTQGFQLIFFNIALKRPQYLKKQGCLFLNNPPLPLGGGGGGGIFQTNFSGEGNQRDVESCMPLLGTYYIDSCILLQKS